jgi:hypothetical protein
MQRLQRIPLPSAGFPQKQVFILLHAALSDLGDGSIIEQMILVCRLGARCAASEESVE